MRLKIPAAVSAALVSIAAPLSAAQPTVIELTQVPCQFVESENGVDRGYKSARKADCEAINDRTAEARLRESKPLELKAGKYVFRVTNRSVPYEVGFYLRGAGVVGFATLPRTSGGGLTSGVSKDYEIELKPGEYVYSCPLNTTPDYTLVVK